MSQITGEYCLERGRESGKPLALKHRGAGTMGGGGERERDVRGREQAGALEKIKNRNGDWSAHSSDWVKSLYMFIYRNSGRAVRGGALGQGWANQL